MENQQPEATQAAIKQLQADFNSHAETAAKELRRLHARVQELEKDRGNAKRLVSKIWNQHPEARDTIEKATGAWLVFGQDVETGGVSAQRVTQGKDHIAQPRKMVAQEPFGYFKAEPFGWRDCAETDEGAIALYEAPQPQADARAAARWSEIGKSIERACGELPEDFEINIHLENGAGTASLLYPSGEECENFPHDDDGLAGAVNAAIAAAKEHK